MSLLTKVRRRYGVEAASVLYRRRLHVRTSVPLISFSFDDFPRSALTEGGSILSRYGVLGTYYVAMGLMGKSSHLGPMFQAEDLKELDRLGHELGCHTFEHCHSWDTPPGVYEQAILENQRALNEVLPGALFKTFAYPISWPRLAVKRIAGRHFDCCRAGGRSPINVGTTDLNLLSATFLEQKRDNPNAVKALIDQTVRQRGWLIFATHDVSRTPSRFGCTPDFFEQVVRWAVESRARILPVVQALEVLRGSSSELMPG
jgi:peptidoglycan/xylan/chitin deacetylase (PgdA/CDA1 family)